MRQMFRALWVCLGIALLAGCAQQAGPTFTISSPSFTSSGQLGGEQVLNGFGCTGSNISPELRWQGAPSATKSYALTMYDPDAPTGSGWWHWVVYNIPASASVIPAGAGSTAQGLLPAGAVEGKTDFGAASYGGPCPPAGDKAHHYVFTLYALDSERLEIPADASAAMIGFNLSGHTLAKASITATYGR